MANIRELLEYAGYELDPLPEGLSEDEPLILPPQPQQPGWITWLEQPEQANNVLTLAWTGNLTRLKEVLNGDPPASPHAMITPGNRSAIYLAALKGHWKCIKELRKKGADPTFPDENGFAPLHLACKEGHKDCVRALIECQAHPMQPNKVNMRPLHMVAMNGDVEIMEMCAKVKGVQWNVPDDDLETPLYYAAKSNCPEAIRWLQKEKGLDVDACNKSGMSPIWIAAVIGNCQAVSVLHELDADLSLTPTTVEPAKLQGQTPIEAARMCEKDAVVKLLEELEGLKEDLIAAQKEYSAANKRNAPKEEQKACLMKQKELREKQKKAYRDAAKPNVTPAKSLSAADAGGQDEDKNNTVEAVDETEGNDNASPQQRFEVIDDEDNAAEKSDVRQRQARSNVENVD